MEAKTIKKEKIIAEYIRIKIIYISIERLIFIGNYKDFNILFEIFYLRIKRFNEICLKMILMLIRKAN